ncbi:MAG: hypothetical protein ACO3JJ_02445 [Opitutaceae bacterium]
MILRSLALLAPLAAAALAQTSPAPEHAGLARGGPAFRGHPLMRVMDLDRDGALSATELTQAPITLGGLDTDGDGVLSTAEIHPHRGGPRRPAQTAAPAPDQRPGRPAGGGQHRPALPAGTARAHQSDLVMLALDANEDGTLAAAELANATRSLGALDGNRDGQLSPDELRPLPPTP